MTTPAGFLDESLYPVASAVFGDRLPLAERYAIELATSAAVRGLIGPREIDRIWERHILNCAVVGELVPDGAVVVDVGAGAGLPGIPLALARPSVNVHLVEPLLRRTQWLTETLADLDLPNVSVERARAEESQWRGLADVVTGRAVAPLVRFLPMVASLLKEPGTVLALKGNSAGTELEEAADELRLLGASDAAVVRCGGNLLDEPTTVVRLTIPRRPASGLGSVKPSGKAARPPRRGAAGSTGGSSTGTGTRRGR